jgi:acyl carrier protein
VPGDKRLVAYVVPAAENVTPESLTEALHRKLPNYMVPSIFVLLESLPITPNGKVDRKALPAPDLALMKADDRIRPRTPLEGLVAEVFARVLNVEEVGIHDNFFELGGHSLLATQVVSRLSNSLGISVSLRTLFESPTVAGLAEELQNADEEPAVLESVVSRSYANVKEI